MAEEHTTLDESETECPTCGRDDFASEQGMKAHHARTHGESLTTTTVECEVCGEAVEKDARDVDADKYHYCSQDCLSEHKRERYSGDGNPRSTLATVTCANCGDELQRPDWMRESRGRHFCDYECMGEWRSDHVTGDDHPRWVEYPTLHCEHCGKAYKVKPAEKERSRFCSRTCHSSANVGSGEDHHRWVEFPTLVCENCGEEYTRQPAEAEESRFCSYECLHEAGHPSGEDHPRWAGGGDIYYGTNFRRQRRKAIRRDQYRCQAAGCSMTQPDHLRRYGAGLDVHHITPIREFVGDGGEVDYETANDLDNLITLCRNCHARAEAGELGVFKK